jgi:MFS family permease
MAFLSFLDKDRSVAGAGYNRWLVPPAALSIHLAIGQVCSFSVFGKPLTHLLGVNTSIAGDWSAGEVAWIFSIAIAVLGISTAVFGNWLERAGPRKAMFIAACCFGAGFLIAAIGVHFHQLWLVYLGYGGVGGIGLGLGYLSPVATLLRWFADRPGLATGLAIMGFGGGALIGSPLATRLMAHFATASSTGVAPTLVVMGLIYFAFMMFGTFTIRIPPPDYKPASSTSATQIRKPNSVDVDLTTAMTTSQFWLLWIVLCTNVTAGIGILEHASPMIQEMFNSRVSAATAGGFVGLLSLFNMGGRFFWSSLSDYIGRKATFTAFFVIGFLVFVGLTFTGSAHLNSVIFFVILSAIALSMYGGGFATMPAYLKDLFGTKQVGAIYGRTLTAWSAAGVLGPQLVTGIQKFELNRGVPPADAYSMVLRVMAGLLVVGFVCNLLIRPIAQTRLTTGPTSEPESAPQLQPSQER